MDNQDYPAPDHLSCDDGPNLAARCKASPADRRGSHLKVCLRSADLTSLAGAARPKASMARDAQPHIPKTWIECGERLPKAQVRF